jgi:hypothetical protein
MLTHCDAYDLKNEVVETALKVNDLRKRRISLCGQKKPVALKMMTSQWQGMLIRIDFPRRSVLSLLQQVVGPNVHEHYVELRPRTYRLFVLQPELNLIQCRRRRKRGRPQ